MTTTKQLTSYGPVQFPDRLGLTLAQFARALRLGQIPPSGKDGRWPAAVFETAAARVDEIRAAVGTLPDMGASRAAEVLGERFGIPDLEAAVVIELARTDGIPEVGEYKDYPLYCGLALEQFNDRAALERARVTGRLYDRTEAAAYMLIRLSDMEHLIRSRWITPTTWVHSRWQRRRAAPAVALFRRGDLDVLLGHPAIDWDQVRQTPRGRPSPLAALPTGADGGGE